MLADAMYLMYLFIKSFHCPTVGVVPMDKVEESEKLILIHSLQTLWNRPTENGEILNNI